MEELEKIRQTSLVTSEKRYLAIETLKAVTDWIKATKPSELLTYEEGSGKGAIQRIAVDEPKMRELWQKWGDSVTKTVFEKGAQIPELLIDDVIALFKIKNAEQK